MRDGLPKLTSALADRYQLERELGCGGMATVTCAEARRKLVATFRRLWATERKTMPVKDVAAAGGWKDITTLMECYQQPDEETLRAVVEFVRPAPRSRAAADVRV